VRQVLLNKAASEPSYKLPRVASLSLVLCGDMHIRALNFQHRNKDYPTDVLSFEMQDEMDYKVLSQSMDRSQAHISITTNSPPTVATFSSTSGHVATTYTCDYFAFMSLICCTLHLL
jgi:rRNA maturation RNase YbeY